MNEIIKLGGDADTNAYIAIGIIWALEGKNNIPQYMLDKIMNFDV